MKVSLLFAALASSTNAFASLANRASYPYGGSVSGLPATNPGGYLVPAPGDTAHQYQDPGPGDLRGPCPGMNLLANHGFLARNGLTNYAEIVSALINAFNLGYDHAVVLTTLGVASCGDVVTGKLSIGMDQTSRTSLLGLGLNGPEVGLNGHNRFEADVSMTRNDAFLGNNYLFNGTLFSQLIAACPNGFEIKCLAAYRAARYWDSRARNPQLYYGTRQILMYGAVSFLYEAYPSLAPGVADLNTIKTFFGAVPNGNGGWNSVGERLPANWKARVTPYSLLDVLTQILEMYALNPVSFGAYTAPGVWNGFDGEGFQNGTLPNISPAQLACVLYDVLTEDTPNLLAGVLNLTGQVLSFVLGKLNPIFGPLGCTLRQS